MTLAERIAQEAIRDHWTPEMLRIVLRKLTVFELQSVYLPRWFECR